MYSGLGSWYVLGIVVLTSPQLPDIGALKHAHISRHTAPSAKDCGCWLAGSTVSTAVRVAVQQLLPEAPPGSTVASRHKLAGPDRVCYYQMVSKSI